MDVVSRSTYLKSHDEIDSLLSRYLFATPTVLPFRWKIIRQRGRVQETERGHEQSVWKTRMEEQERLFGDCVSQNAVIEHLNSLHCNNFWKSIMRQTWRTLQANAIEYYMCDWWVYTTIEIVLQYKWHLKWHFKSFESASIYLHYNPHKQ